MLKTETLKLKRLRRIIILNILFIICFAATYTIEQLGFIDLRCPVAYLTPYVCPGCGLTRMVTSIIKADFEQAFRWNPFIFVSIPLYIYLWVSTCISYIKYGFVEDKIQNIIAVYVALLLVYGVVRNISIFSVLAPTKI